ncbi:hypothetical protein BASA81_012693 [Batrachochytrium salamandrivorans]|nr:hypothetical protein BASA81_012693 [Batrachochytrium salamandrivorans]
MTYRSAYGKKAQQYGRALYMFLSNYAPKFSTKDAYETMLLFDMPTKFVTAAQLAEYEENLKTTGSSGYSIKLADDSVKKLMNDPEYVDAFCLLMLDYYKLTKPEYPLTIQMRVDDQEADDEHVATNGIMKKTVDELYSIDLTKQLLKNKDERFKCSDVHKNIIALNPMATSQKIKKYFETALSEPSYRSNQLATSRRHSPK